MKLSRVPGKPAPVCGECGRHMWWHGSAQGWGCPIRGGDPACCSPLYRPKPDPGEPWPYGSRYPELPDDHEADR